MKFFQTSEFNLYSKYILILHKIKGIIYAFCLTLQIQSLLKHKGITIGKKCPKIENSHWKCVSRHICSLICGLSQGLLYFLCSRSLWRKGMMWSKNPGWCVKPNNQLFICMFLSWYLHPIKCSCCGLWLHILQEIFPVARRERPFSTLQVYVNGVEA